MGGYLQKILTPTRYLQKYLSSKLLEQGPNLGKKSGGLRFLI